MQNFTLVKENKKLKFAVILATDNNGVIGTADNTIPWNCPIDMKFFKNMTDGHPIIMGRKTYESIGKPLPNRKTIVLTQNKKYKQDGVYIASTLEKAMTLCPDDSLVFICGGAEIYNLFFELNLVDLVYHTKIDLNLKHIYQQPKINLEHFNSWLKVFDYKPTNQTKEFVNCRHLLYSNNVYN